MGDAQKLKKAENDVNEQLTLFYFIFFFIIFFLLFDQTSHNYNYHSSTAEATSDIPSLPVEQQQ